VSLSEADTISCGFSPIAAALSVVAISPPILTAFLNVLAHPYVETP